MKYIVFIPDGMADYPLQELKGKTPLEAAKTPNMDFLAENGCVGQVKTIPARMAPASDVANLSILGYDPQKYYTGRGPLEAANLGISLKDDEVAFRANLVTVSDEKMVDYSAGHITTDEARKLIKFLDEKLRRYNLRLYVGVSYRHLMTTKKTTLFKTKCTPPHDIIGKKIKPYLPKGEGGEFLIKLMRESQKLLANHEINQVRIDLGENPANMLWFWGQGKKPDMPNFEEKYGVRGSIISAVDLIKGMGKTIGLEPVEVPGATGYYDTNYLAKARYGLSALRKKNFIYIHVEASDEAGHNADLREKILAIERFDKLIVGYILRHTSRYKNLRIMLLPDHATPISVRTHTKDPVPFVIYGKGIGMDETRRFNEKLARKSKLKFNKGHKLMSFFISENI